MAHTYQKPFIFTLIALGLMVTGWSLVVGDNPSANEGDTRRLVAGLSDSINNLTEITVIHQGVNLTLKKKENGDWVVPSFFDYPVDMGRLRGVLHELAQSRLLEKKTAREENYTQLGLREAEATRLILKAGEQTIADVWLGRAAERRRNATYVRFPTELQAWLASGRLQAGADVKQWVRQHVVDIRKERVKSISVERGNESLVRLSRDTKDDAFQAIPIPKEINKAVQYQLTTIPQLFARLKLVDVMPESELRASGRDVTIMQTFDGLTLRLRFNGEGDSWPEYWVTLEAATTAEASDAVKKEAEDINARVTGWSYRFAPYLMTQLRTSPEAMMNYKGPLPVD